jgi:hypothetical protein
MVIEVKKEERSAIAVPEISDLGTVFDFIGNKIEIGDSVIFPYRNDEMNESVLLVGKVTDIKYQSTTSYTKKVYIKSKSPREIEAARSPSNCIKIHIVKESQTKAIV